jgi:hypothetical protein
MAKSGNSGSDRQAKARKKGEREGAGWFVILRVDELGESTEPGPGLKGEKLTVIDVVEGRASDEVSRRHRDVMQKDWAEQRAGGGADLPDVFPIHRYRCVALSSFIPGHYVEEERKASSGLF